MYKTLHPEDITVTNDDLEVITLAQVIAKGIYNDLGFAVKDRLIILAEAQSTVVRALIYLMSTYQDYLKMTKQDLYSSKHVKLPEPELYVIYTGNRQIKKDYISLSEEFFDGRDIAIDACVKIVTEDDSHSIIDQYIIFCKTATEYLNEYGLSTENIKEVVEICKRQDILRDYLSIKEKEVVGMLEDLFNQEAVNEMRIEIAKEEGRNEGRSEGRKEGRSEGREEALKEAYEKEKNGVIELYKNGVPVDIIAKSLKRDKALVQKWLNEEAI